MNNLTLMVIFLLLFNTVIHAQEKSAAININPQVSFFQDNYSDNSFVPINPGGEILYEYGLNNKFSLSTGVNYSYSIRKHSVGIKSHFKRVAHEMYLPFIVKYKLNDQIFTESGIYSGWLIKGKALYMNNSNIKDWQDNTENTSYNSTSRFSADLYFGADGGNQEKDEFWVINKYTSIHLTVNFEVNFSKVV